MEICGKDIRDYAARFKNCSGFPCCLNIYNKFIGVFSYVCVFTCDSIGKDKVKNTWHWVH